jgi:TolB-like protein/Tfp pilus assembly protein PilF
MPSFFAELQRRHVYKVGAMYAVAGWLLVQVVTQVLPVFDVSALAQRIIVMVIVAGFPVALLLSWIFDITPQGIVRTDALPEAQRGAAAAVPPGRERLLNYLLGGLLLLAAAYLAAERIWPRPVAAPLSGAADKSIAVLPFENLSDDKNNAYFAEGIQDEILTRLAKIGELRVISRTSSQQYAAKPANLADAARQLGVANVLEGSVQKIGDAVHINVQLIRAAGDDHLWAESYDRKLDNVFGVEAEVAQAIAQALQARLSGGEAQNVAAKPTDNPAAYDAYLRGLGDHAKAFTQSSEKPKRQAEADFAEAVRLDPAFALAWARLSIIKSYIYFTQFKHEPGLLDGAREAADTALKLRPELGEAYLAQGYYRYWGLRDFDGGLQFFHQALQRLPNNADVLAAIAYIERRKGHWQESTQGLEQATLLDPRNAGLIGLANNYSSMRQFPRALAAYDQALAVAPQDADLMLGKVQVYQDAGDLDAAGKLLAALPPVSDNPALLNLRVNQLQMQRRYDEGIAVLQAYQPQPGDAAGESHLIWRDYFLGFFQIFAGRPQLARAPCSRALDSLNGLSKTDADSAELADDYAAVYACLGDKTQAVRYAQQAVQLSAADAMSRAAAEKILVMAQAFTGDADAAIAALPRLLREPAGLNEAELRDDPFWDALRPDPRFQALLATPPAP